MDLNMMTRRIADDDWSVINAIQNEAYTEIAPESQDTLRRRVLLSPETCFVAVGHNGSVLGCCLAHPWGPDGAPALHAKLEALPVTTNLYLHDLAVSSNSRGRGVAGFLCQGLLAVAVERNFQSVTLVSVQNSAGFWKKFGFSEDPRVNPSDSYGAGARFMRLDLNAGR